MHKVPTARRGLRVIDPDQVCDATAVLADAERVQHAATVLDALGEVNRLSILLALQHAGDLCVSDLAVAVGMSDSAVSHALRLLRAHGMVTAHREGRLVRYRMADGLARRLLEVVSADAVAPVRLHAHGHSDEPDEPE
ncbi:MAG: regulatory protein ArsR [Pseudonocardia sp.]|uniref:ArsR/SmtB family transcription factor n=1 Tax=Pseudonocardia sp. TaxID=60912 RepID=UPI002604E356|nr:metalloregulator ArsR/SmtB family transcription factor [Pseudonocardia sp.]MCU1625782.1 regulatory protein ArsR [Pseudonocardia sp.]MDT7702043.1 ArsR family transcriptional regulator, lead/cadmium/zinc/bismuth-responsive transcriptional [Pseudonocardiales bacterium]